MDSIDILFNSLGARLSPNRSPAVPKLSTIASTDEADEIGSLLHPVTNASLSSRRAKTDSPSLLRPTVEDVCPYAAHPALEQEPAPSPVQPPIDCPADYPGLGYEYGHESISIGTDDTDPNVAEDLPEILMDYHWDRPTIDHHPFVDLQDFYKRAVACFWTKEEVDLSRDLSQFQLLSEPEQLFIRQVLAFFAFADQLVSENLVENFYRDIQVPSAR